MLHYHTYLVLLISLLAPSQILAQSDYVVTSRGDTLTGVVKIIPGAKLDRLQLITTSKKTNYNALQAKSIKIDQEIFHAIQLGENMRYMKLIRPGHLSLYGYRIDNQTSYDGRLLRKVSGETFDVPTLLFRTSVLNFIEDCDSAAIHVKQRKLSRDDLDAVIDEYNTCMDEKYQQRALEEEIRMTRENKMAKLEAFMNLIETMDIKNKSEIVGLLKDIKGKVESDTAVPSYQKEALKDYLKDVLETKDNLEGILKMIQ